MVAVLAALAVLQYRWSKRVTDATEARINASLKASILDWHLSLLREISEPAFAMQVSSEPDNRENWNTYFERYRAWHGTATRPELFANLYLIRVPRSGEEAVFRRDIGEKRFHRENPPPRFAAMMNELRRQSLDPEMLERRVTDDPHTREDNLRGQIPHDPLFGWQFEQNLPALVHPLIHNDVETDEREGHGKRFRAADAELREEQEHARLPERDFDRDDTEPVTWIVIELDAKVLEQKLLPELALHYFGGPQGANYDNAVIAGRTERVLYSSSPEFVQRPFDHPDAVLDIFGPPPTNGTQLSHDFAGDFHAGGAKRATNVEEMRNMAAPTWMPVMQDGGHEPHWNLVVRHRRGSLEAQMAAIRRRDLGISLGILLLLGATMTMLIVVTRRAQRLARLQMEFVATVSHELRTPLAVICSAADNLSDGVVNGQQQLQRYGEMIKVQGRQLIALVEQILLFAATREGRQTYHLERLDVRKIIEVVVSNTAGLLDVSGVKLESEMESGLPQVIADLSAVSQCVQNLVINAVKYGGEAKWVRVTARRKASPEGREILIGVEDRGMGIAADELEHVFEPFYRSPQIAAAQIRGTGLGLPLAKSLAEAMNGSLTVSSEVGKGSTFTLHLPFAEDSPLRTAAEAATTGVLTSA